MQILIFYEKVPYQLNPSEIKEASEDKQKTSLGYTEGKHELEM